MREFDYIHRYKNLLTPEIVSMLAQIHEYKGEQKLFIEQKQSELTELLKIAKIQSTEASNRIEGIHTSDERLKKIVLDKTIPQSRNEQEIAGYRDVLTTIHENYDYIPLKPTYILQLHGDLCKFIATQIGGKYKSTNNVIAQEDENGNQYVRFKPLDAWETPQAVEMATDAYNKAVDNNEVDPLIAIPMFILDFLSIHPFNDGNGRMSRLLTLLLLYRAGYIVGKYISIEKIIERSKETYYETLLESSKNWEEGTNDYFYFVRYMFGVIVAAYRDFADRVKLLTDDSLSKPDRVREIVKNHLGKITKMEILQQCPDVSQITVQRALNELLKTNEIKKIGGGRYTSYVWNVEKE